MNNATVSRWWGRAKPGAQRGPERGLKPSGRDRMNGGPDQGAEMEEGLGPILEPEATAHDGG